MKNKNIKTILFASLMVAMILPFSGMQFATAETVIQEELTDQRTIAELKKRIDNLKSIEDKTIEERHGLKQYEMILDWFNADGDSEKQRAITANIKADFPTKYTQGVELELTTTQDDDTTMGPIYYTGSTEKNYNCTTQGDDLGNAEGSLTMYGTNGEFGGGWTYWGTVMNYPYEINNPAYPGCADVDWDHSVYRMTAIPNTSDNCEITTYSSSTGAEGKVCDDVEGGMFVLTEGQSFYSTGNSMPFSAGTSYKYVYLVA